MGLKPRLHQGNMLPGNPHSQNDVAARDCNG